MKTVDRLVAVSFGCIAAGMAVLCGVCLAAAAVQAGSLQAAFALLEEESAPMIIALVGGILAAVYGIVALFFGLTHRRYVRRAEELSRFGVRVKGRVVGMKEDILVRIGRQRPVFVSVACVLPDGTETVLRSHRVWRRDVQDGMPVDVLLDPEERGKAVVLFDGMG